MRHAEQQGNNGKQAQSYKNKDLFCHLKKNNVMKLETKAHGINRNVKIHIMDLKYRFCREGACLTKSGQK